ncbi:hypothetical protein D3C72_1284770 [compost metagenome]
MEKTAQRPAFSCAIAVRHPDLVRDRSEVRLVAIAAAPRYLVRRRRLAAAALRRPPPRSAIDGRSETARCGQERAGRRRGTDGCRGRVLVVSGLLHLAWRSAGREHGSRAARRFRARRGAQRLGRVWPFRLWRPLCAGRADHAGQRVAAETGMGVQHGRLQGPERSGRDRQRSHAAESERHAVPVHAA